MKHQSSVQKNEASKLSAAYAFGAQAIGWLKRVKCSPMEVYVCSLVVASCVGILLLVADSLNSHSVARGFLLWNLMLAWVPFILALWLRQVLTRKLWSSWEALFITGAWLIFLPNAFYMVSDFVHLPEVAPSNVLFEVILFTSFIYVSIVLGFSSLLIVRRELVKRASVQVVTAVTAAILLACSFAVYIGRDLRWNSWDVLINPTGLLFDISERLTHPAQYGEILAFVVPLFILLLSMYILALAIVKLLSQEGNGIPK